MHLLLFILFDVLSIINFTSTTYTYRTISRTTFENDKSLIFYRNSSFGIVNVLPAPLERNEVVGAKSFVVSQDLNTRLTFTFGLI